MSPFGLKLSQMILHTETSKLMYNQSSLFVVLHKPTLLPSTFNESWLVYIFHTAVSINSQNRYLNQVDFAFFPFNLI